MKMKLLTGILLAGILMECITILVATPLLDAKSLTKPVKATEKVQLRTKREPGVALVLSIIDKNSPKIQKLEIEMDDKGYHLKDRNSNIRSAVGKRLISKLLEKGNVMVKSELEDDDAQNHKWDELLEIFKEATKCKNKNDKYKKHHHHNDDDDDDENSFKPQKIGRKSTNSDADKLKMIVELIENWKNKSNEEKATEITQTEDLQGNEELDVQSSDEELEIQSDNQETDVQTISEDVNLQSDDDKLQLSDEESEVNLRNDELDIESTSEELEINKDSDEPLSGSENKSKRHHHNRHRKPHHKKRHHNRKPKPEQKTREDEISDDEKLRLIDDELDVKLENDELEIENSSEELELNQESDELASGTDNKSNRHHHHRRRKPHHRGRHHKGNNRKPKPEDKTREDETSDDDTLQTREEELDVIFANDDLEIEATSEELELKQNSIKRRPKPEHIKKDDNNEETDKPIKRRLKPEHIKKEEGEEIERPIKRRQKPKRVEKDDDGKEPVKRRLKPKRIEEQDDVEEPVKRRLKPKRVEKDDDHEEPVKRRLKPKRIEEQDDVEEPLKRRLKPEHIEEQDDVEEPVKRRLKPEHIEGGDDGEELVKRKPKPGQVEVDIDVEELVKRKRKPGQVEVDIDVEELVKRKRKPGQVEVDIDIEEPVKRKLKPEPVEVEIDITESCENCDESDETYEPKREHDDDESCEDCKNDDDQIERRPKPESTSDEQEGLDKFGPKKIQENSNEPSASSEEEHPSADDLDEEQLLQGIAFIQNQLKRFLGIDCTCNPTENNVLSECPLHNKSSARRRREDKNKVSKVSVRSSSEVSAREENKKLITNKKFTKKASLKSFEKRKNRTEKGKQSTKKSDSLASNSVSKTVSSKRLEKLPTTTTENVLKLLKDFGLSAHLVQKSTPRPAISTIENQSSSKTSTNNDELQFFRNKAGVRRPGTKSKSSSRKNGRKLRNRRKGNKSGTSTVYRPTNSKSSKRTQRGITSEEIAARKQEDGTSVHNYETENDKKEVILSRPITKDVEDIVDPEFESLLSLYRNYKERVQKILPHDQHTLPRNDAASARKDESLDSIESGITESVENILRQISVDHGNDFIDFPEEDDISASKEYVITDEADGNLSNLYNRFTNLFGTKDVESMELKPQVTVEAGDGIKRKFKYDEIVSKTNTDYSNADM